MIIIFSFLLIIGLFQLLLWRRQQKRMQRLQIVEAAQEKTEFKNKLQRSPFWQTLSQRILAVRFHLIGNERNVFLRHMIIVLVIQGAGIYINKEYLQFNPLIVQPIVFIVSLYALYLKSKKDLRKQFEDQFSESLNIINSSIRAGNSVIQGITECGERIDGILGREFKNISQRLEIGEDVASVFISSWKRLPYHEYYFFIVTVQINMKGGGQVKDVMSRLGKLITNERIVNKKKYAMTSEARMSVKVLAVIPVLFFVFLNYQSPESVDILLNNPIGQIVFYYAIGSILFGLLVVWIMMNRV